MHRAFKKKLSSRKICIQIFQKFLSRDGYASMEIFHSLPVMHFPVITFSITSRYAYRLCMQQSSHASCANKNIQTFEIERSIFNQFAGELNPGFKKNLAHCRASCLQNQHPHKDSRSSFQPVHQNCLIPIFLSAQLPNKKIDDAQTQILGSIMHALSV